MPSKTLQQWFQADSIRWEIFWKYIDEIDEVPKRNRPVGGRTRGGWQWPEHTYNCPQIFKARFNLDGTVRYSISKIAELTGIQMKNKASFLAGIIQKMISMMNHPYRRVHWDKSRKCPYCQGGNSRLPGEQFLPSTGTPFCISDDKQNR